MDKREHRLAGWAKKNIDGQDKQDGESVGGRKKGMFLRMGESQAHIEVPKWT
jgi:hypothetical protein